MSKRANEMLKQTSVRDQLCQSLCVSAAIMYSLCVLIKVYIYLLNKMNATMVLKSKLVMIFGL